MDMASLPYIQAQGNSSSKSSSLFEGRRAASAQPLSLDFCNYSMAIGSKTQRSSTAAAHSMDELIASFAGKPLPYEVASATPESSQSMLEPVAEDFGSDAEQDQSSEQRPSSRCFNNEQLSPAVQAVLDQYSAVPIGSGCTTGIAGAAQQLIWDSHLADTFYTYDLGEVARLYHTWCATMPRVKPFYAVKCNPDPGVVAMLNALGAGFDCASIQELERAAAHDVPQSRVIFANPCKRPADFRYAAEKGVEYTTFDCASELEKIAAWYPSFKCVLRIRCDDADAKINLGLKYGADMTDVPYLLQLARSLGLQVVGVSFHVGSGCQNVGVYAEAIESARQAFDAAAALGYEMTLLDIGGGFTAPYNPETAELFYRTADVINAAIDTHFPADCGVRIIAEPGR
jgi:ornithine decarboxylase